jgi:hypothetical protein
LLTHFCPYCSAQPYYSVEELGPWTITHRLQGRKTWWFGASCVKKCANLLEATGTSMTDRIGKSMQFLQAQVIRQSTRGRGHRKKSEETMCSPLVGVPENAGSSELSERQNSRLSLHFTGLRPAMNYQNQAHHQQSHQHSTPPSQPSIILGPAKHTTV